MQFKEVFKLVKRLNIKFNIPRMINGIVKYRKDFIDELKQKVQMKGSYYVRKGNSVVNIDYICTINHDTQIIKTRLIELSNQVQVYNVGNLQWVVQVRPTVQIYSRTARYQNYVLGLIDHYKIDLDHSMFAAKYSSFTDIYKAMQYLKYTYNLRLPMPVQSNEVNSTKQKLNVKSSKIKPIV